MRNILVISALALLAACTGTRELYQQADTPLQYTKVVLLHHNALAEEAANIVGDPTVPAVTKAKVRAAYKATVCSSTEIAGNVGVGDCADGPVQKLEAAGKAFDGVRTAENETQLQSSLTVLVNLLSELITAIKGAT